MNEGDSVSATAVEGLLNGSSGYELTAVERMILMAVRELQQPQSPLPTDPFAVRGLRDRASRAERDYEELLARHDAAVAERDKLASFKEKAHEALDKVGVPTNPVEHMNRILSGHRVVDRIAWLAASRDRWEDAAGAIGGRCQELVAANEELRALGERERVIGMQWQARRDEAVGELRHAMSGDLGVSDRMNCIDRAIEWLSSQSA